MEIDDAGKVLPQEAPILMLEKIVDILPGKAGKGVKQFLPTDTYFTGHFPGQPILPGIYLIEAMAQTAMAVLGAAKPSSDKPMGYLAKVDKMSFYKAVEPGQKITFAIQIIKKIGRFYMVEGEALRDGEKCASGGLTLAMSDDEQGS